MATRSGFGSTSRRLMLLCCSALLVGGVSACTGPGQDGGTGQSSSSAQARKLTSQMPAATKPVDTVTWDLPQGEPSTIDPARSVIYSPDFVVSNLCDPLMRQKADFSTEPNLATPTQIDPTTLQFTLRPGVKFWNGDPVTADDVVFSMTRIWKDANTPVNYLYQHVASIEATAPDTVGVKFTQPDELFVKEMSTPAGMVVQKSYTESRGATFGTAQGGVMCSGPYQLKEWQAGNSITLVKNPSYWNTDLEPNVGTVRIEFVTDTSALAQRLQSGEIDGAYELPASIIPSLTSSPVGTLNFGPSPQSLQLSVARPDGPLTSQPLRQAIWQAIDRQQIADAAFHGSAEPNFTNLAKTAWDLESTEAYQRAYEPWVAANKFDPDAARKLVASSGYNGTPLTIATLAGDSTLSTVAQILQQQFAAVGIKVSITPLQPIQYSTASSDASARQGIDLLLATNFNQVPDPLEFMGLSMAPGGAYNYANFDGTQAMTLLNQAQSTLDPKARAELVLKAQDLYEQQRPSTSLVNTNEVSFLNNRLGGAITSFAYMFMPSMAYLGGK